MNRTLIHLTLVAIVPLLSSCSRPKPGIEKEPLAARADAPKPDREGTVVPTDVVQAEVVAPQKDDASTPPRDDAAPEPKDAAPEAKPVTKLPPPTSKDWEHAGAIAIASKSCDAKRLGDFIRVSCPATNGSIEQLAGDARNVVFGCWDAANEPSCVVFKLQPGQKRVFQFTSVVFSGGWGGGVSESQEAMVSAWWPKSAASPKLSVR